MEDNSTEIANPVDELFEVISTDELQSDQADLIKKYAGALMKYQPMTQIAVGGASGWIVGCIFKKVGRVAASAIGGGVLMLQVAHQCGYISVNWSKVNLDMKKTQKHVPKELQRNNVQPVLQKIFQLVKHNAPITLGFAGGVLIGIST